MKNLLIALVLGVALGGCAKADVSPILRTGGRILLKQGQEKLLELAVSAKPDDKLKLETVAELLAIADGWLRTGEIDGKTGMEALGQAILLLKEVSK